jgi:membrane-associated phospholipid phosphatase
VAEGAADRLGGAVPSPAFAFLLSLISLASLFWLVTFKRTTESTLPEQWLMEFIRTSIRPTVIDDFPLLHQALLAISALGSGWFVALGFAALGLLALAKRRTDLAMLLALGTLAFPIEWALKYFTAAEVIAPGRLLTALFNIGAVGLDDIADFPAGHALRATALYGIAAFCVARLAPHRRQGMVAYTVAMILIGAISAVRLYLGAHFPLDVLGGWMAGGSLLAIVVAIHVMRVDERQQAALAAAAPRLEQPRRVAVPRRRPRAEVGAGGSAATETRAPES